MNFAGVTLPLLWLRKSISTVPGRRARKAVLSLIHNRLDQIEEDFPDSRREVNDILHALKILS